MTQIKNNCRAIHTISILPLKIRNRKCVFVHTLLLYCMLFATQSSWAGNYLHDPSNFTAIL